jgi:hypothetical protein
MLGGRIIGEGEDGCVSTGPVWPCASGSSTLKQSIDPMDPRYVSKIVSKTDKEDEYILAANRILGPELSAIHLVQLKESCAPANSFNPPSDLESPAYKASKESLIAWTKKKEACDSLKQDIIQGRSIASKHKLMYISKYPMTLDQWANGLTTTGIPLQSVYAAIPPFIRILQKLIQGKEQLINLDLHAGNIFVRPQGKQLQFGLADFGRCLLRQPVSGNDPLFFGKYLCENTAVYELYASYNQIPLEARLLNFCYVKRLEHLPPGEFLRSWVSDPHVIEHQKTDVLLYDHTKVMEQLRMKPIFIATIETIQSISRKLRASPTPIPITQALTSNEKTFLDYMITRYSIISPINIIGSICLLAKADATHFIAFVKRAIMAPYLQTGSSLAAAFSSIQRADMGIVWSDVVNGR